jgi:hypothetical protein
MVGDPVLVSDSGQSFQSIEPVLAFNGNGYGVVYLDSSSCGGCTDHDEIFFSKLDSSGNKLQVNKQITKTHSRIYSFLWNGSGYALMWSKYDTMHFFDLTFTRLDMDGNKIGDVEIFGGETNYAALSWNWGVPGYGVAYANLTKGEEGIYFKKLDLNGNMAGEANPLLGAGNEEDFISLACDGSGYGMVWDGETGSNDVCGYSQCPEIHFARLDGEGNVTIPDKKVSTDPDLSSSFPQIAYNGKDNEFGIGWEGSIQKNKVCWGFYFTRLDSATGNKLMEEVEVTGCPSYFYQEYFQMAWSGSEYAIAWETEWGGADYDVFFRRFNSNGTGIGAAIPIKTGIDISTHPSFNPNDTGYGIVWQDWLKMSSDVAEIFFTKVECQ